MKKHDFHPSILRSYDIRGIIGKTLSNSDAFAIGITFGSILRKTGKNKIIIGRDGRLTSKDLSLNLIDGLVSAGCNVINIGEGPTPMLYFADLYFNATASIQITGSHNPSNYNGFKFILKHRSFFGENIIKLGELSSKGVNEVFGGTVEEIDVLDQYVNRLKSEINFGNIKTVWDAGNGAAGPIIKAITANDQENHLNLFCDVDGNFPNHHPNPVDPKTLETMREIVLNNHLTCGLGFDGDGDRIGIIDSKGRQIPGDLLTAYLSLDVLKRHKNADILFDVKSSNFAMDLVREAGGNPLICKTGHSYMKDKIWETKAPLAGEMSGHIFISDGYYGYDDAIYVAIRVLNLINEKFEKTGETISDFLDNLPEISSTPECRIDCPEDIKFKIIDKIKKNLINGEKSLDINTIDGIRVTTDDGWWLIRASNTEAALVVRAEGINEENLQKQLFKLKTYLSDVGLDWEGPN